MPGPAYIRAGARSQAASGTSRSPAKPTVDSQNGILIAIVTSKNNATHSTATAGWTRIGAQVNSGANFTASIWIAAESAAAPTFTWTGSVANSAQISYYTDPAGVTSTTVGATTNNNGTTSTHSTVSINTTVNKALVVYIDVAAANTAIAQPSGWTERADAGSGTDAGRTAWGDKEVATSGSASGAISVTGANAAWVQWQIELYGVAGAANTAQWSKADVHALLDPPTGAALSKVDVHAWLDDIPDVAEWSKVDVHGWLEPPLGSDFSKVDVHAWLDMAAVSLRRRQLTFIN
jgi:hypothetical protein